VLHAAAQSSDLEAVRVGDHMTAPVITASPNWDVTVAATEMTHRHIRHLVVVDREQPLGVVSLRDVLSVFLPERVHQLEA
jgi:CBS domain-containing protein